MIIKPLLNAVLSLIAPGLGQAREGEIRRGIIFFVIAIIISPLLYFLIPDFAFLYWIYAIYVAYDAYTLAK